MSNLYRVIACAVFYLSYVSATHAAPLGIPTPYNDPDVTSNGLGITYDYTSGSGGTLTITGLSGTTGTFGSGVVLAGEQYTTSTGQTVRLPPDGGSAEISASPAGSTYDGNTPYLLVANFDEFGAFIDGSVRVDGYAVDVLFGGSTVADPFFTGTNTGTILTADLLTFGFTGTPTSEGDRDKVIFEWTTDLIGGDLYDLGFDGSGGAVASGNVFWGTLDPDESGGGVYGGLWDPLAINDMSAFTSDFVSCSTCPLEMNTFVPVPAAVWLFASGLLGIFGVGRRRRKLAAS